MLCPRCQKTVDPTAAFCGNCGFQLAPVNAPITPPAAPEPSPQPFYQPAQVAQPVANTTAPWSPPVPQATEQQPVPTAFPQPPQQPTIAAPQDPLPSAPQPSMPPTLGTFAAPLQATVNPNAQNPAMYPPGLPAQPVVPGYPVPIAAQPDHSSKAIASFVLGVLGLPGCLIPIVGITLGILAIVFGTLSIRSARKIFAIIGMSLAAIVILASLFFWVHATQEILKEKKTGVSGGSSDSTKLQNISTPCYTTKVPADMKITQTAGSCTFQGISSDNSEQEVVKVLQVPSLTLSNLSAAAKADAANVVGAIPGGSIGKQRSSTFAGSQSYEIEIKASDGSAGLISYVYDTTSQGNLVIVLHTQARASGTNYDLSSIESNWSWL